MPSTQGEATKPAIFSFFSGIGMLDLGFEHSGFEVAFVNELHAPFLQAYQHSRSVLGIPAPQLGYAQCSIDDLLVANRLRHLKVGMRKLRDEGRLVGFIGGPPCPDFSIGGKNRGRHGDNGQLSASYIALIRECKPDFFLFENVKGLWRTKKHRRFYEQLKRQLEPLFHLTERLINAIEYGAPQDRDRLILIGFRKGRAPDLSGAFSDFDWHKHTLAPAAALLGLPWPGTQLFVDGSAIPCPVDVRVELTVEHWFRLNKVTRHPNARHCFTPRAGLKRFLSIPEGDDSRKSYKRLHRWRYSPTACYGNNEVHLHPYRARRISAAEALAIQSLPPDFELPQEMTLSAMFKAIGNGVPFVAARGIGRTLSDSLEVAGDEIDGRGYRAGNRKASARPSI